MSFNFPPESYSAVYTGATAANAPNGHNNESAAASSAPAPVVSSPDTPPPSLLGCFHCALRNGIKVIRHKHVAKNKVKISMDLS